MKRSGGTDSRMIDIRFAEPQHKALKKYILYYYFIQSENDQLEKHFIHYPHYRKTLNIYKDASLHFEGNTRLVHHKAGTGIQTIFTNNYHETKQAKLTGKQNIIGIIFKPLGLNYFLPDGFAPFLQQATSQINQQWPRQDYELKRIFKSISLAEKNAKLDAFFLQQLHPLKDERIQPIIDHIIASKGEVKVSELTSIYPMSRRTLLRLFHTYVGCSTSKFKQVVKFRNALDGSQDNYKHLTLTQLSLESGYYDQADFVNQFKSITAESPKKAISKITRVGEKDLYWQFRDKG